ncbi:hypothetical protein R1flu_016345 [Riccia fluitans]|uniref:Uncharacterized protein n=1 Tax=Riccia fluitans TaxID=41844 RepID=A0ABD1YPQ7_9MARC
MKVHLEFPSLSLRLVKRYDTSFRSLSLFCRNIYCFSTQLSKLEHLMKAASLSSVSGHKEHRMPMRAQSTLATEFRAAFSQRDAEDEPIISSSGSIRHWPMTVSGSVVAVLLPLQGGPRYRIESEFNDGAEYRRLERKFCKLVKLSGDT